jgi:nucleotide-binding universal stress UspA family protein
MNSVQSYKILAAVDLSDWSERVFNSALAVARDRAPADVHVIAVAELLDSPFSLNPTSGQVPPEAVDKVKAYTTQRYEAFKAAQGDPSVHSLTAHVLLGAPADEIVWLAAHLDVDLIVLGTHGRKGLKRVFMGSVAEKVTRLAGCPVLVARDKAHDPKIKVPEIEPPVDEEHPANLLRNHHYTPVFHARSSPPTWGGIGG